MDLLWSLNLLLLLNHIRNLIQNFALLKKHQSTFESIELILRVKPKPQKKTRFSQIFIAIFCCFRSYIASWGNVIFTWFFDWLDFSCVLPWRRLLQLQTYFWILFKDKPYRGRSIYIHIRVENILIHALVKSIAWAWAFHSVDKVSGKLINSNFGGLH